MSGEECRYKVDLSSAARRSLNALPPAVYAAVMELLAGDLAANPRRVGKPLGPPLAGAWSARRGAYRVVYEIEEEPPRVRVLRIEHRADVYRPR